MDIMKKTNYRFFLLIFLFLLACVTTNGGSNKTNIEIVTTNQGFLISNSSLKIKLFVPSKNLTIINERIGGGQDNPNYFYIVDTEANLHLSGWIEPSEKFRYNGSREYWASEYKNMQTLNPEFRKNDIWEVFIYDTPLPKEFSEGCSAHMRAHFLKGDTWIDLHLSITALKTSAVLHEELREYIKMLQIMEQ